MDPSLLDAIRDHYDRLSPLYQRWWGEHIHHGYWEGDESPAAAQDRLTARLAERAGVPRGAGVLDVGCGLGGSALWLARRLGCSVTGITISPVQAGRATERARAEGLQDRTTFRVLDANRLDLPAASFDVVWVIECSEHLADKARFIESCARVLRPGGRLALCAWLAAAPDGRPGEAELVEEVCRGMLCPSLARLEDYAGWMRASGLEVTAADDITHRVARTWDYCGALTGRPEIQALLLVADRRTREFVKAFGAIRRAYAEGAMRYGMFTARKAGQPPDPGCGPGG
jgi:tocopherol O-methyltransferase